MNNLTKKSRSILATIGDVFIALILSVVLFSTVGLKIISSIPSFNSRLEGFNQYNDNASALYYNSKLGKKGSDDSDITNQQLAALNIKYYVDENYYDKSGKLNDSILYFYTDFAKEFNLLINDKPIYKSVQEVNENVFKFKTLSIDLWDKTCDIAKPLKLSSNASSMLKDYLNGNITDDNKALYNSFIDLYTSGLSSSQKDLVDSNLYQTNYQNGKQLYLELLNYYAVGSIITLFVIYLIINIIVPISTPNNQTIMRRVFKIRLVDKKDNKPKWWMVLLSSLFAFLTYLPFSLIIIIPTLGEMFIYSPIFFIGGSPFYFIYFLLIFLGLQIASIITFFINKKSQNLGDLLLSIFKVDMTDKKIDEVDEYEKRILERNQDVL